MPTVLALSICSFCKMDLRYWHWEIITEQSLNVISIPTILTRSPKLVNSHSASRPAFVHLINSSVVANNNRSSTQIVTIMKLSPSYKIYSVFQNRPHQTNPRPKTAISFVVLMLKPCAGYHWKGVVLSFLAVYNTCRNSYCILR